MKKYLVALIIIFPFVTIAAGNWFIPKVDRHREILGPLLLFQNSATNSETQNQHNRYLRDILIGMRKMPCQLKSRIHEDLRDGSSSVEIVCISQKIIQTPSKDPYVIPYIKFWFESDTSVSVRVGRQVIIEPISVHRYQRDPMWLDILF